MDKIKEYYKKDYVGYRLDLVEDIIGKLKLNGDELRRVNRYYHHPLGERRCSGCGGVSLATSENFYVKRYFRDKNGEVTYVGLSGNCKRCDKKRQREDKLKVRQNPEHYCSRIVSTLKSRAKEFGLPFNLTGSDLYDQLREQDFLCYYSGEVLDFSVESQDSRYPHRDMPSVDRLKPKDGYVSGNVVWAKYYINRMKNDLTFEELLDLCLLITENFGQA